MKNKLVSILVAATLVLLFLVVPSQKVFADAFCFVSVGPNASTAPVACSTVKTAGSNPNAIKDNKCYRLDNSSKWVEVKCDDPNTKIDGSPVVPSSGNIPSATIKTTTNNVSNDKCGKNDTQVNTSLNYGCKQSDNPIVDFLFAMTRFLAAGVGIVVIGSIVLAGIQYTTSRGDPNATARALERVRNSVIALILYIFAFALVNWLVPGGLL